MIFQSEDEELKIRAAFYKDSTGAFRKVLASSSEYDPLVYTLLFPYGGTDVQGWETKLSKNKRTFF